VYLSHIVTHSGNERLAMLTEAGRLWQNQSPARFWEIIPFQKIDSKWVTHHWYMKSRSHAPGGIVWRAKSHRTGGRQINAPCFFGLRSFLRGSGTLVLTGNLWAKFISCHAHGSFHALGDLYPVSIDWPLIFKTPAKFWRVVPFENRKGGKTWTGPPPATHPALLPGASRVYADLK
jgi:hypothetical protein